MVVWLAGGPTVQLTVMVPIPLVSGTGWTWAEHPEGSPVGHEYVYSAAELAVAIRVWGSAIARVLIRGNHDRFALVAHAVGTGVILGRDNWRRSAETRQLIPDGAPFTVWEPAPAHSLVA